MYIVKLHYKDKKYFVISPTPEQCQLNFLPPWV